MESRLSVGLLLVAAIPLLIYFACLDYPATVGNVYSDIATYYVMGYSFARDGDMVYERKDLERTYRDWSAGPQGIFLKTTDSGRVVFAKPYIYPLIASVFISFLGTNGFLVLNACLIAMAGLAAILFLIDRGLTSLEAVVVTFVVFGLQLGVVYVGWIAPETLNVSFLVTGTALIFVRPGGMRRALWYMLGQGGIRSDDSRRSTSPAYAAVRYLVAGFLLGTAVYSKLPHLVYVTVLLFFLFITAIQAWWKSISDSTIVWIRFVAVSVGVVVVLGILFAGSLSMTGEFNAHGGNRKVFTHRFPYDTPTTGFADVGVAKSTDSFASEGGSFAVRVWNHAEDRWEQLRGITLFRNVGYYLFGRFTGVLLYFPLLAACVYTFLRNAVREWRHVDYVGNRHDDSTENVRFEWQESFCRLAVLTGLVGTVSVYIVMMPGNFMGGTALGNRYFVSIYPLFIFLVSPPVREWSFVLAATVALTFLAPIFAAPFASSHDPSQYAMNQPHKSFPVELSCINDIPINVNSRLVRVPFEADPSPQRLVAETEQAEALPYRLYFLDGSTFLKEEDLGGYWVRGKRSSEVAMQTARAPHEILVHLTAGKLGTPVRVSVNGEDRVVELEPHEEKEVRVEVDKTIPFDHQRYYTNVVVHPEDGFIPRSLGAATNDHRYLGVFVRLQAWRDKEGLFH